MTDRFLKLIGELTFREWTMLGVLFTTLIIMWWRVGSNIREVIYIRRLRTQRGRHYAANAWGTRQNSLVMLLIAETLVAVAISVLIFLMLAGAVFY